MVQQILTSIVEKLLLIIFKLSIVPILALLLFFGLTTENNATEVIRDLSEVEQGSLLVKTNRGYYQPLPLLDTEVQITIAGLVARAKVKQFFQNQSEQFIEASYIFPLPEESAVDHLTMIIGERKIIGQIKEKAEAKRIYQRAKSQGKKTALLQQKRANIFSSKVANIAPGEVVEIQIEYQQLVHFESGEFSLRFPTAITPRYHPRSESSKSLLEEDFQTETNNSGWTTSADKAISIPLVADKNKLENSITIDIELDAGLPIMVIDSPYHNIIRQKNSATNYQVSLHDYQITDRDFELRWRPEKSSQPRLALFTEQPEESDDGQYLLLMVTPPDATGFNSLPRELTLVVDQSGSMEGASMTQAILALEAALTRLRPEDKFNVIAFNQQTRSLFNQPVDANSFNLLKAKRFVTSLQAKGGTEMLPALRSALAEPVSDGYVRQIVFLTDGAVSNEEQLFSVIHSNLAEARLFTIGIGSAPNSYFMRKAAQFGRGTFTYIGDPLEVADKMQALFQQLESPVMQNIRIDWPTEVEQFPQLIPDLYLGEPLLLRVKAEQFTGDIHLSGEQGTRLWQATIPINNLQQSNRQDKTASGISVLWARAKIAALLDEQIRDPEKQLIRQQVTDIALQHHLVSRYTSLVAVEEQISRSIDQALESKVIANHLPVGSSSQVFAYPSTAAGWQLQLLVGCLMLILSAVLWLSLRALHVKRWVS